MPYTSISSLAKDLKDILPKHAQEIYRAAYNSAWTEYKDKEDRRGDATREETAHRVAWSAVKKEYRKGDDGKWHKSH